jgi:hypothetical protein
MPLAALDVGFLDVTVVEHRYHVQFEAVVQAPAAAVSRVLTDYASYAALDPAIRSSEVLGRTATGQVLLRTRIRACAAVFCRSVVRTEQVTEEGGRLVAEVLPAASDLRRGVTRTQWREEGGRTRVWYQSDFEPAFWVPEAIARRFAAGSLRESVLRLWRNVEERARGS